MLRLILSLGLDRVRNHDIGGKMCVAKACFFHDYLIDAVYQKRQHVTSQKTVSIRFLMA
jgi:hypothetical protein